MAGSRELRELAEEAGATVEGERIVFDDEWQLARCMGLAVDNAFATISEVNREQRDRAEVLLERWRERFGSRYERLGSEDHYAEGVALHLTGVNRRQRRTDLSKAERDEIEAQVGSVSEVVNRGS